MIMIGHLISFYIYTFYIYIKHTHTHIHACTHTIFPIIYTFIYTFFVFITCMLQVFSSLSWNVSTSDSSFSIFFWWIGVRNTSYWSVVAVGRALVSPLLLSTMSITVSAAPLTHSIWWLAQSLRWQNVEQYGVRLHREHSANASRLQLAHYNSLLILLLLLLLMYWYIFFYYTVK